MADTGFEPQGDFIDGSFELPDHPTGELVLEDPGDVERRLGAFPFAHDAVPRAVEAARRAYPAWRDLGFDARAALLRRFGEAIAAEKENLAEAIALEVGKPLWEARTEAGAMVAKIELSLGPGQELVAERELTLGPGQTAHWRHHARGALAVLGPFNFPGHLVHGHVVPALASGNTVIVKPSDRTPAVGQLYAQIAARTGFPPGVFNHVQGDGASGAALAAHPDVDGVLFTGSYAVGRQISAATLDQPHKLVALELGGKNGVLVLGNADLEAAARAIVFGATVTTGQRCSATSRVIALAPVADALQERIARLLEGLAIGHSSDADVFMGPLISADARDRHAALLDRARSAEAECIVAGGPITLSGRAGHYVRPSLHRLAWLDTESAYQMEEHFVPDIALLSVGSLEEGIAALEAPPYGLVASVFSASHDVFERVYRETRLGLLNWNTSTVGASGRLPFGGVKRSGNDRPAGITASLYCTYPVASVEHETPDRSASWPGFPEPDDG